MFTTSRMKTLASFCFIALLALPAFSQQRERGWDYRQQGRWLDTQANKGGDSAVADCLEDNTNRREAILNGNRITSQILNFGSISSPGNTLTDIVWNGLGYGYEFGPFVAAEVIDVGHKDPKSVLRRNDNGDLVPDAQGNPVWVMHIVSDGIVSNGAEISPDQSERWGWQPIPCAEPVGDFEGMEVVSRDSDQIPTSDAQDKDLDGKPDSWPSSWYNENLKEYVWPGALQQGSSNADKEALYFMNDYSNKEFAYFPFTNNTIKKAWD